MSNNRLNYIDTAKGIGMLIVITLHTYINFPDNNYIGSLLHTYTSVFFMPLFFFISGIFFNCNTDFKNWVKKKFFRLIIPFIFFYIFTYLLNVLLHNLNISTKNTFHYIDIFQVFWKDVYSNNVIWFLLALFWCSLTMFIILKLSKNIIVEIFLVITLSLIGYYCSYKNINIPLYVDSSFSSLPILYFGILFKRFSISEYILKNKKISLLVLSISIILVFLSIQGISLVNNSIKNPFLFLLGGLSGSFLVLIISFYIERIPVITYIGNLSLLVLCTHIYIINIYVKFFNYIQLSPYYSPIMIIVLVCISYYIIGPFFKLYLPFIIGEKRNIKI